jgi:hypothetical protein
LRLTVVLRIRAYRPGVLKAFKPLLWLSRGLGGGHLTHATWYSKSTAVKASSVNR